MTSQSPNQQQSAQSPAWTALVMHLNSMQPPPPGLFRAAWLEHAAQTEADRMALWAQCMELRHLWVEAAELIKPSVADDLTPHLNGVVRAHALNSPPRPALPRVGLWRRITGFFTRHF